MQLQNIEFEIQLGASFKRCAENNSLKRLYKDYYFSWLSPISSSLEKIIVPDCKRKVSENSVIELTAWGNGPDWNPFLVKNDQAELV